ncbi:hypothetical protein E2C01_076145 [Portunus trituberculatus]|uniref:Uncharacterized protein n=1 Tax=Portunus trituberculatus TaxID=210409 RepID=A0A5B7IMW0_PORTR|nr:hypothetical protein [Portunus trituberculatus]
MTGRLTTRPNNARREYGNRHEGLAEQESEHDSRQERDDEAQTLENSFDFPASPPSKDESESPSPQTSP